MREMQIIANNLSNMSTAGFKQQGVTFSEYVKHVKHDDFLSMAVVHVKQRDYSAGTFVQTGAPLDVAIQGEGFFAISTPQGVRLTRSGQFSISPQGVLVNNDGHPVLNGAQAEISVPEAVHQITIGTNGTLLVDGEINSTIGIFVPENPQRMNAENGVLFRSEGALVPSISAKIKAGFVEQSNVDPVLQIARMIEVQRAFEIGQKLVKQESQRKKEATQSLGA